MGKVRYNRISVVLDEIDMSGKELASKMNITEQTVSGWRTNSNQPSIPKLFEIAEAMGVEANTLISSKAYSMYPLGLTKSDIKTK